MAKKDNTNEKTFALDAEDDELSVKQKALSREWMDTIRESMNLEHILHG